MRKGAITTIYLLILIHPAYAQRRSSAPPAFIFGTWRIFKFEEVGGHGSEKPELAKEEIGRKVRFGRNSYSFDGNFLFFESKPCSQVRYTFEVDRFEEYVQREKGTPYSYGLEGAKENQTQSVVVSCGGRPMYYFELAKGNQLAIYYDGWFFFLEKMNG
ncbi:MAG TPA: hypothetical protein VFV58_10795 [Blastocatellia bacterium]|jgi:hypothetical protein|nr:hypothetical protein [Blastocatellia bacterium]